MKWIPRNRGPEKHIPVFGKKETKNLPGNKKYPGIYLTHDLPFFIPVRKRLESLYSQEWELHVESKNPLIPLYFTHALSPPIFFLPSIKKWNRLHITTKKTMHMPLACCFWCLNFFKYSCQT
jgi:hypothetical protein